MHYLHLVIPMTFYADLHIHSKYSRATSKDCNLEQLAFWAAQKGIQVVGTGKLSNLQVSASRVGIEHVCPTIGP